MSRVFVCGLGAVSPAGWDVVALRESLRQGQPLPTQNLSRPGWLKPLEVRRVPQPVQRPAFMRHPRLRRVSPLVHYAASAVIEAMKTQDRATASQRTGLVVCLQSGCVQHSCRFFSELLEDPASASPIVFPETVYASPASHIAALIGNASTVTTLVGDPACFLQGLAVGANWLLEGRVDACVVVGAEEQHWLLADALWHFEHSAVLSSGAGAVLLSLDRTMAIGGELEQITDAHTFTRSRRRGRAARDMRAQLPPALPGELLCLSSGGSPKVDAPELAAWEDWRGPRMSPKRILGEGLMAAAAWQCVAACDTIANGNFPAVQLSVVGCNQQAVGARIVRADAAG